MNAQAPVKDTWQSIGEIAARLVEEKARQRWNAPGPTASKTGDGDEE